MIRILNRSDEADLLDIFLLLKTQSPEITGFSSWSNTKILNELKIAQSLAYVDEKVRGFIIYRAIPGGYEVILLGTHPQHQRRGIMAKILDALVAQLEPNQLIWLEVHEKNKNAQRLYEKLGFKTVGRRPRYYSDGSDCLNLEYRAKALL